MLVGPEGQLEALELPDEDLLSWLLAISDGQALLEPPLTDVRLGRSAEALFIAEVRCHSNRCSRIAEEVKHGPLELPST